MKNAKNKINNLNQLIQEKLCDKYWDADIACRVIQVRKDRQKRWVQLSILPVLILGTTTLIYYSSIHPKQQNDFISEESILKDENNVSMLHDHQDFFNKKFNYNEHLMNTVFNNSR